MIATLRIPKRRLAAEARVVLHWFILCVGIPFFVVLRSVSAPIPTTTLLSALVVLYSGTRLATIITNGADRIVAMTFWLFAYVFLGLSAILQIANHAFPWPQPYGSEQILLAQLLVLAGIIAFDLGYRSHTTKHRGDTSQPYRPRFLVNRSRIYIASVAAFGASLYSTVKLGGLRTIFLARSPRDALLALRYNVADVATYDALAKTIPYALLIVLVAYRLEHRRVPRTVSVLVVIFAILTLIENNPIATARFQVGTILLSLYFVGPWKGVKARNAIYGLLAGLLLVFPYADLFRSSSTVTLASTLAKYKAESPLVSKPDYDSFQQIMNGMSMVHDDGFRYGQQLAGAFLFWVPRAIWTGKAEPTGRLIAESRGYVYTNLSSPLWIEFYVDGGWLLVACGFVAYGYGAKRLDQARRRALSPTEPVYLATTIFAGYQIFLLRGSLMPAFAYFAPVLLTIAICTKGNRAKAPDRRMRDVKPRTLEPHRMASIP